MPRSHRVVSWRLQEVFWRRLYDSKVSTISFKKRFRQRRNFESHRLTPTPTHWVVWDNNDGPTIQNFRLCGEEFAKINYNNIFKIFHSGFGHCLAKISSLPHYMTIDLCISSSNCIKLYVDTSMKISSCAKFCPLYWKS